jgi:hypothetical protein
MINLVLYDSGVIGIVTGLLSKAGMQLTFAYEVLGNYTGSTR